MPYLDSNADTSTANCCGRQDKPIDTRCAGISVPRLRRQFQTLSQNTGRMVSLAAVCTCVVQDVFSVAL